MNVTQSLILATLFWMLGDGSGNANSRAGKGNLRLELAVQRLPTGLADQKPWLKITIINLSEKTFWINKRMSVDSPKALDDRREVVLEVRDSDGREYPFSCRVNSGPAGRFSYVLLYPGEVAGAIVDLNCFELSLGRTYRIVARYRDGSSPKDLPEQFPRFRGELVSSPIELRWE